MLEGGHPVAGTPTVYGLVDPREPERIRYVGQTRFPEARYCFHLASDGTVRGRWVRDLKRKELAPTMVLLQRVVSPAELRGVERAWIDRLREVGQADLNDMSKYTTHRRREILARLPAIPVPSGFQWGRDLPEERG